MITIQTNDNHEIVVSGTGNLVLHSGVEAIVQTCREYMQTRRAEMIHAIDLGIPFDPVAFGASPNVAQFEAAGRARLMQVPDVLEVLSFTADVSGDVLSYSAVIKTTEGETTVNG